MLRIRCRRLMVMKKRIVVIIILFAVFAILVWISPNIIQKISDSKINSNNYSFIAQLAQEEIGNSWEKYCAWYGYDNRVEWCAVFVCWIADKAGYEANVDYILDPKINADIGMPQDEGSGTGCHARFHEKLGRYHPADSRYIPNSGDLIYFVWEENKNEGYLVMDHIGIVEKVENGIIYTIEGNSTIQDGGVDLVRRKEYYYKDKCIRGFSCIESCEDEKYY